MKTKGKVIRVDEESFALLKQKKRPGEKFTALIRRLLGLPHRRTGRVELPAKFVLPSDLHHSKSEARGAAVIKAVRSKRQDIEEPTEVREVG